jgi:hypothetical protein
VLHVGSKDGRLEIVKLFVECEKFTEFNMRDQASGTFNTIYTKLNWIG